MTINLPPTKSWMTTASGLITCIAGYVMFSPEQFAQWPWIASLAKFITLGGLAALGLTAKDSRVTGGTIAQDDKAGGPPAKDAAPVGTVSKPA